MTPGSLLLDIDGTLVVGGSGREGRALEGAVEAVRALSARFPLRYVTNTTSKPRRVVAASLARLGFPAAIDDVLVPARLAERVMRARGDDRGVLIAPEPASEDLAWFAECAPGDAKAVLVADEAHDRTLRDLWPAVEALHAGARLYCLQQNRYYWRGGRLVPDLGPLAAYLGYAANVPWEFFGKPSRLMFESVAADLGLALGDLLLVGDDAEFDVAGSLAAGLGGGVLVRTGKYREGDETRVDPPPTLVVDSIADLPDALGDIR